MSRYASFIQRAGSFIESFDGSLPLEVVLRNYFKQHRVMGSTDRRVFKQLLYNYYRIVGNNAIEKTESVLHYIALLIATLSNASPVLEEKHEIIHLQSIRKKFMLDDKKYFPLQNEMSAKISIQDFLQSHLVQPKTFIRIRKGAKEELEKIFTDASIGFDIIDEYSWAIEGNYPLTEMECYANGKFEIQDYASQQTGNVMLPEKKSVWWDCCSGSGGKSLLLLEKEREIQLHASDIRQSILLNYGERMWRNKFKNIKTHLLDLSNPEENLESIPICDWIIADVPCTGSGTWGRSPAMLRHFDEKILRYYVELQKIIVKNVLQKLKTYGELIYITCSVYAKENEENIDFFTTNYGLKIKTVQYLSYPHLGADTMFIAVLQKQ